MLDRVVNLARSAQAGQRSKQGTSHSFHPLAVICRVTAADEKIAVALHHELEDTAVTLDYLRTLGLGEHMSTHGMPSLSARGIRSPSQWRGWRPTRWRLREARRHLAQRRPRASNWLVGGVARAPHGEVREVGSAARHGPDGNYQRAQGPKLPN